MLGEGRRVGGTWHGRLILKGFGDPALTSSDLKRLVGILRRMGIRHVTGGIAGDESAFDSMRVAHGWLALLRRHRVPAPLRPRRRPRRTQAAPRERSGARGRSPVRPAAPRPGITARGAFEKTASPDAVPLATIYSEPLSEILTFMDHWSDNFTAEMVLKAIGYHALGLGTTRGGAAITHRILQGAGIPMAGVKIADGSGLSRDDRVTARELTTLLVKMWNDPTMRDIIWSALPVAGRPGTLQHRLLDTPHHTLLRGKTGTTDIASALSGYVGRRFAFVTIENGHPVDYWAAHTAEDGVVQALLGELRGH